MPEISSEDLLVLVSCARSYKHRLPHGIVPSRIWNLLSMEQQDVICDMAAGEFLTEYGKTLPDGVVQVAGDEKRDDVREFLAEVQRRTIAEKENEEKEEQ